MSSKSKNKSSFGGTIEVEHAISYSILKDSIHFHPKDQSRFVYVSGCSVVIGNLKDPHDQIFLRGHDDLISSLKISSSGTLIASSQIGENADICLWDFKTGKMIFRLDEHDNGVDSIDFSKDEKLLVSVGDRIDNRMLIWDTYSGGLVGSIQLPKIYSTEKLLPKIVSFGGHVRDIKKRETSKYQIAVSIDNTVFIYQLNPKDGSLTKIKLNNGGFFRKFISLTFSNDGEYLYLGSTSGDFGCFHVRNNVIHSIIKVCAQGVTKIIQPPQNQQMIIGGGDGTISIFNGNKKGFVLTQKKKISDGSINSISLSNNQEKVLVGTSNCEIFTLKLSSINNNNKNNNNKNKNDIKKVGEGHKDSVTAVSFIPDSNEQFATCSMDRSIAFWDLSDYSVKSKSNFSSNDPNFYPLSMCFINDVIIAGFSDGSIRSVDSETGDQLWSIPKAHRSPITALTPSFNNKFIISGGGEGCVRVWDIKTKELIVNLKEHQKAVTDIKIFKDDYHILSASKDKTILCWNLQTEKRISSYSQNMGSINSLALSNGEMNFITVGSNKKISFWDIRQDIPTKSIPYSNSNSFEGSCIELSHDNKYFAVGGTDEDVSLFDYNLGKKLSVSNGHSDTINDLKFSHDDKQLISVGKDDSIFIFNIFPDDEDEDEDDE